MRFRETRVKRQKPSPVNSIAIGVHAKAMDDMIGVLLGVAQLIFQLYRA
jgi:hypothetical protein